MILDFIYLLQFNNKLPDNLGYRNNWILYDTSIHTLNLLPVEAVQNGKCDKTC
jgi:hypothetical protein